MQHIRQYSAYWLINITMKRQFDIIFDKISSLSILLQYTYILKNMVYKAHQSTAIKLLSVEKRPTFVCSESSRYISNMFVNTPQFHSFAKCLSAMVFVIWNTLDRYRGHDFCYLDPGMKSNAVINYVCPCCQRVMCSIKLQYYIDYVLSVGVIRLFNPMGDDPNLERKCY